MGEEPEDLAKAEILRFAHDIFTKDPNGGFRPSDFSESLNKKLTELGFDTPQMIEGLTKLMAETGQLRKDLLERYRISAQGREDLFTIYDDHWMSLEIESSIRKQEEQKRKEKEKIELEERRHQELVKAAREGNKIQKYAVWIALALGAIGLIVAIFKP
jgi:predicted AlkP superfamily pyrophosphatase or phosphodiesterase